MKTGDPLHIIGMKGTDNGQFLQPITVCFLQMTLGGTATAAKSNDFSKDDHAKTVPILAVGDSNNRLQVRNHKSLKNFLLMILFTPNHFLNKLNSLYIYFSYLLPMEYFFEMFRQVVVEIRQAGLVVFEFFLMMILPS